MSCIRQWDGFSQPVQFTYKGNSEFNTVIGGLSTIFTTILLCIYGGQQLIYLFMQPDYESNTQTTFLDFTTNSEEISGTVDMIEIDTQYSTVAASALLLNSEHQQDHSDLSAESVVRISFFATSRDGADSDWHYTYYPAVRCQDVYAEQIAEDEFFQNEMSDPSWICPDTDQITLLNNPFLFETGQNFVMVINRCDIAVELEQKYGFTSYSDVECLDAEDAETHIADMRISYKLMAQNFNPKDYAENGKTQSVIKYRFTADLLSEFSQSMKFQVAANFVKLFDYWFVDLRDFTFFIKGYVNNADKFNIVYYVFDYLGTSTFSQKYQTDPTYGYFSVDLSQAEEQSEHLWSANTFTGILSNMGGYSTVITSFFGILIGNYQSFIFDKSMLKKLYFQEKEDKSKDKGVSDSREEEPLRNDEDEIIEKINNRRSFWFGYFGYGLLTCTSRFCCCCKKWMLQDWPYYRRQWLSYQRFKKARELLHQEKDVEHMIYNLRILKFLEKTILKKRQRDMVQYFMRYLIEDDEVKTGPVPQRNNTANQLVDGLDPENDDFDRRILFELAGRRVQSDEYRDDTSYEEGSDGQEGGEMNQVLSDLLGVEKIGRRKHSMSIPVGTRPTGLDSDPEESLLRGSPGPIN